MTTRKPIAFSPTQLIAYVAVALLVATAFFAATDVFGGAGTGSTGSTSGTKTTFTKNTPSGTTGYSVTGGVRTNFSTNCGNCSVGGGSYSGGGGGRGSGGGQASGGGSQPRACNLTVNKPVITLGTTTLALSWTPTPVGEVTLRRSGISSGRPSVPNNAVSFTDTVAPTRAGTITYTLTYPRAAGSVRGASTDVESEMNSDAVDQKPVTSFFWNPSSLFSHFVTPAYAEHTGNTGGKSGDSSGEHSGGGGGGLRGPGSGAHGGGSSRGYACTVEVRVVTRITECNDGIDNGDGEDTLSDQQDPGCHTDGNPRTTRTYDPNDTSESNTAADMRPSLSVSGAIAVGRTVQVTASARNTGTTFAGTNDLVYGYRDVDTAPNYCSGRRSRCFTHSGRTYMRLDTYSRSYAAGQQRTAPSEDFTPTREGSYELCAIADYDNDVTEGAAGEANNSTCRSITVTDVPTNPSTINGDITLNANPERVRSGLTSTLTWNTGGRVACTLTGSNGETIAVSSMTGTAATRAITAQTVYTLACTDSGFAGQDQVTISILPRFQEI